MSLKLLSFSFLTMLSWPLKTECSYLILNVEAELKRTQANAKEGRRSIMDYLIHYCAFHTEDVHLGL